MRKFIAIVLVLLTMSACSGQGGAGAPPSSIPASGLAAQARPTPVPPGPSDTPAPKDTATPAPTATIGYTQNGVPVLDHVITLVFENHNYSSVIGNKKMPEFNRLAKDSVLFTHWYAVTHPSLPNYLALIGGDTFGISKDCGDCYVNQVSLPDLIEKSGRTWKTYQEDMPKPCDTRFSDQYDVNHNPFVYFDPVRTDKTRCDRSVVPLTALDHDLSSGQFPNYAFIMGNLCNSGHDCDLATVDQWLKSMVDKLQSSPALGRNYAIFVLFDEAEDGNASCCGMPEEAGGRIAALLISPLAKPGFKDDTSYSHYSLLKTIAQSWDLPGLGHAADPSTPLITDAWLPEGAVSSGEGRVAATAGP